MPLCQGGQHDLAIDQLRGNRHLRSLAVAASAIRGNSNRFRQRSPSRHRVFFPSRRQLGNLRRRCGRRTELASPSRSPTTRITISASCGSQIGCGPCSQAPPPMTGVTRGRRAGSASHLSRLAMASTGFTSSMLTGGAPFESLGLLRLRRHGAPNVKGRTD